MFFWWICGGESVLPVLLLCHLSSPLPQTYGFLMALVWKMQGLFSWKKKKVFYVCCISFLPLITFPLAAFWGFCFISVFFLFFWPYISPEIAIKILETIMCSSVLTLHDDFVAFVTVHPPSFLKFSSPLTCVALSFSWNDNLCWSDFSFFRLLNELHFFRYLR